MGKINFDFGNNVDFNPEKIQVEETINVVLGFDISPSMGEKVKLKDGSYSTRIVELNKTANEFIENMAKSHVKDRLLVSTIVFSSDVKVLTGFQPVTEIDEFKLSTENGSTALYGAARLCLDKAVDYRDSLVKTGVKTKTIIILFTDGENNNSPQSDAQYVKDKLIDLNKEEQNIMTFSSVLLGIGDQSSFKQSFEEIGFHAMAELGDDIRKAVSIISSSVTSVSNGQNISKVNF